MQKNSSITGIIIAAVLVVLVIVISRYTGDDAPDLKPTISVASLSIKEITDKQILADAKIHLDNPMPFEISARHLDYQVSVNGSSVLRDRYEQEITVESDQGTLITVPFKILSDSLERVLAQMENSDSAEFVFHASVRLDAPIAGEIDFEFKESKTLPAFRPLDVNPKKLNIEDFSWENSTLTLKTEMENNNSFPMKMQDVRYEFTLDGDHVLTGTIEGRTEISPQSTVEVPVTLRADNLELGKLAWKALFDKDDTPFSIKYSCTLVSDNESIDGTPLEVNVSGVMEDFDKLPAIP